MPLLVFAAILMVLACWWGVAHRGRRRLQEPLDRLEAEIARALSDPILVQQARRSLLDERRRKGQH